MAQENIINKAEALLLQEQQRNPDSLFASELAFFIGAAKYHGLDHSVESARSVRTEIPSCQHCGRARDAKTEIIVTHETIGDWLRRAIRTQEGAAEEPSRFHDTSFKQKIRDKIWSL